MPRSNPHASLLDEVDRRLIGELVRDGRASYARLARVVDLSETAVRARVQRLLNDGLIDVSARIHSGTAGLEVFGFALIHVAEAAVDVARSVAALPQATFVVSVSGDFDILAEIGCHDLAQLGRTMDELRLVAGVSGIEALTVISYEKQDWSGLVDRELGADNRYEVHDPNRASALDITDRRIIDRLIADGRATYAELSEGVGLSQTAVRSRVHRLLESGVVVVHAHVNADALGVWPFAAALIRISGGLSQVVERLAKMPSVTMVATTLGRFDLVCEVWGADNTGFLATIDEIRGIDGVTHIATHNFLSIAKEQYGLTFQGEEISEPNG